MTCGRSLTIAFVDQFGAAGRQSGPPTRRTGFSSSTARASTAGRRRSAAIRSARTTSTRSASPTARSRRRTTSTSASRTKFGHLFYEGAVLVLPARRRVPLRRRAGRRRPRLGHAQQRPDAPQPGARRRWGRTRTFRSRSRCSCSAACQRQAALDRQRLHPGTQIFMNGTMVKGHCRNSKSKTYAGDDWVRVEVEVHGGDHITHNVEGQTVLEYEKPTIGGGDVSGFDPAVKGRHAPDRGLHHDSGREPPDGVPQDRAAEPLRLHGSEVAEVEDRTSSSGRCSRQ